jgi:biopolymer transport protein ExbB
MRAIEDTMTRTRTRLHWRRARDIAAAWLAAGALLLPATAQGWWKDEWKGRKQLVIDTSAAGGKVAQPVGAAAVLVRLHVGNFKFDAAKEDGSDLRFVAADDKTPLAHHVEKWDPLLGEALVWVGLPDVQPGARTDLWLYFGNPNATPAEDAKGTYDTGTALVYHFDDRGQAPHDVSTWANHAAGAALPSAEGAIIGRGLKLDGTVLVTIPAGPSLTWSAGSRATWSAWIRPAEANQTCAILSRQEGGSSLVVGLEGGKPFVEVVAPAAGPRRLAVPPALDPGSWHHLAVVAGDEIALFVDGIHVGTLPASLPNLTGPILLGGTGTAAAPVAAPAKSKAPPAAPAPLAGFKGDLDEVQIAKVERPPGWMRFAAISQGTDPGKLLVAGVEEESGSLDTGYFGILIKSVTLDGWVVIGLLAVMALVSWLVMIGKAQYLSRVERGNDRFAAWFRDASGELAAAVERGRAAGKAAEEGAAFKDAAVYRIYQAGAGEIRKRTDGSAALHAEAIEAIRASMDAALVRENQRLNRLMVFLTIAISGGPFLGLLGTVVGVMITFAAIAAAGDVNVNAIAPGIAAALVATVAGLGVAIPALFGYNWLLTRIKNASAVLQVFVDELVTKVAEAYSEREILAHRVSARPPLAAAE